MQIASSSFIAGEPQIDGRRYINETHIADDGRVFGFEYLADDSIDCAAVMTERALSLVAE